MKKWSINHLIAINVLSVLVVFSSGCEYLRIPSDGTPTPIVEPVSEQKEEKDSAMPPVAVSYTSDTEVLLTLLRYSRYISDLSAEDLEGEIKKTELSNGIEPSARGQLKLAVLLSLPSANIQNVERATSLLSDLINAGDESPPALREYAHLLLSSLQLRVETQKQNKKLNSQLKLERKKRIKLEEKLEALKSIEKSITKRQSGTDGGTKGATEGAAK